MTDIDDLHELERELGPTLRSALQRAASTITADAPPASVWAISDGEAQNGVTMVDLASSPRILSTPQRRRPRVVLGLIAAAAAVVVVAVVVALSSLGRHNTAAERSKRVAESFMNSWVGGDSAGLKAVLAPDATFEAWTPESLAGLDDWLQALHWQYQDNGCEVISPDRVLCDYTVENDLTRAFGKGPVDGSFLLGIDGEAVTSVQDNLNSSVYRAIAIAFGDWLYAQHSGDVRQMYTVGVGYPRVDPISVGLWKTYTRIFIDTGDAYIARSRLICGAAHDKYDGLVATAHTEAAKSVAAADVLDDALAELQTVAPPAAISTRVELAYGILGQLVEAYRGSPTGGAESVATQFADLSHIEIGLERCAIDPSR